MDKPDIQKPQVVSVCPSCGLAGGDGPHGTTEECIRALEAEIRRLSELVTRVKNHARKRKD